MEPKKNNVWWIVGIVVIIIIIIWAMASKAKAPATLESGTANETTQGSSASNTSGGNTTAVNPANATPSSAMAQNPMSMKQLLASASAQKCTFVDSNTTSSNSGTIYVAGGKLRGDMSVSSSGKTMITHMITLGQDVYIWPDASTVGFKSSVNTAAQANANPASSALNIDKKADYRCQPWPVDQSKFVLPSGVNFMSAPKAQ